MKPSNVGPTTYPGIPSLERLEWVLLGDIYAFTQVADRGPGAMAPRDADGLTGLPKDEAPRPIIDPVTGLVIGQTLGSKLLPASMARAGMDLACSLTLWAGSEDTQGGYTPGLAANHISVIANGKKTRLSDIPRSQWSEEATSYWREFAFRIRKVFGLWASRGLCNPQPVLYELPEPLGLDLMPRVIRPYMTLVEIAKRVIPGTPWANRPKSILHDLTPEQRASQPAWARESYAKETGGSVAAPLKEDANQPEESAPCHGSNSSEGSAPPTSSRTTPETPPSSTPESSPLAAPASPSPPG